MYNNEDSFSQTPQNLQAQREPPVEQVSAVSMGCQFDSGFNRGQSVLNFAEHFQDALKAQMEVFLKEVEVQRQEMQELMDQHARQQPPKEKDVFDKLLGDKELANSLLRQELTRRTAQHTKAEREWEKRYYARYLEMEQQHTIKVKAIEDMYIARIKKLEEQVQTQRASYTGLQQEKDKHWAHKIHQVDTAQEEAYQYRIKEVEDRYIAQLQQTKERHNADREQLLAKITDMEIRNVEDKAKLQQEIGQMQTEIEQYVDRQFVHRRKLDTILDDRQRHHLASLPLESSDETSPEDELQEECVGYTHHITSNHYSKYKRGRKRQNQQQQQAGKASCSTCCCDAPLSAEITSLKQHVERLQVRNLELTEAHVQKERQLQEQFREQQQLADQERLQYLQTESKQREREEQAANNHTQQLQQLRSMYEQQHTTIRTECNKMVQDREEQMQALNQKYERLKGQLEDNEQQWTQRERDWHSKITELCLVHEKQALCNTEDTQRSRQQLEDMSKMAALERENRELHAKVQTEHTHEKDLNAQLQDVKVQLNSRENELKFITQQLETCISEKQQLQQKMDKVTQEKTQNELNHVNTVHNMTMDHQAALRQCRAEHQEIMDQQLQIIKEYGNREKQLISQHQEHEEKQNESFSIKEQDLQLRIDNCEQLLKSSQDTLQKRESDMAQLSAKHDQQHKQDRLIADFKTKVQEANHEVKEADRNFHDMEQRLQDVLATMADRDARYLTQLESMERTLETSKAQKSMAIKRCKEYESQVALLQERLRILEHDCYLDNERLYPLLGLELTEGSMLAHRYSMQGVAVKTCRGPAKCSGIQHDDLIQHVEVNHAAVIRDLADFKRSVEKTKPGDVVVATVLRNDVALVKTINVEASLINPYRRTSVRVCQGASPAWVGRLHAPV